MTVSANCGRSYIKEIYMKKLILFLILVGFLSSPSYAASPLEGEYLCNDCHGYLTIKANKPGDYKVKLVVAGGSCGGEVFVENDHVQTKNRKMILAWKNKQKICKTEISVDDGRANVSDSCIRSEDEDSSTCAVLGDYIKRVSAK
jgi:hypothetical protein